jgi:putative hemolysin
MLEEGSEAGVIEQQEHDMVRNVFRLDDRQIGSLMIPRADITYLDVELPLAENLKLVSESEHSRFPVCRGGLHEVLGIVNAKQLLNQRLNGGVSSLAEHLQPAVFVPESLTGMDLLEHFRASGTQMVLIVDEYGEVEGMVTLQDVLEAVTGEFKPRNQEDAWAVQREDGSWLLDGLIPVPELKDRLDLKAVPEEDKGRYHTLSGLLMWLLGRMPQTGDLTHWEGWRLEVVDLDGKRIDKVLATREAPDEPVTEGPANP